MASGAALPPGWEQHQDPEGRPFYFNASTGESTYDPPGRVAAGTPPPPPSDSPARGGGALPDGWSALQDGEGRTYYANSATGETSWDPPAGAGGGGGGATAAGWSLENTYGLGPRGCEHLFEGKARLLDPSYRSVSTTVDALCSGELVVEDGLCVLFSDSRGLYYLIWRDDKATEARTSFFVWSCDQAICLGPVGNEHTFQGKAEVLPCESYSSVSQTIDALNLGEVAPDLGYCVVFSDAQQLYYLVYRADKEAEASELFPAWQPADDDQ